MQSADAIIVDLVDGEAYAALYELYDSKHSIATQSAYDTVVAMERDLLAAKQKLKDMLGI